MKKIYLIALIVLCHSIAEAQSRSSRSSLFGTSTRSSIGLQAGVLSFYGDVRPTVGHNLISGQPGARLDYMLELGEDGLFAVKLNFMYGWLKDGQARIWGSTEVDGGYLDNDGNFLYPFDKDVALETLYPNTDDQRQYYQLSSYEEGNLNFRTTLYVAGLQGEYRVRNIPGFRNIYPYISAGVSVVIFNPFADRSFVNADGEDVLYETERLNGWAWYQYPNPEAMRPYKQEDYLNAPGQLNTPPRDKKYETQLSKANLYGQGSFSTITVGFPLEVGFDFRVMPNINIRLGTSLTFTLTDYIDGVSGKDARAAQGKFDKMLDYSAPINRASRLQTNKYNDFYAYTYAACYIYLPFL